MFFFFFFFFFSMYRPSCLTETSSRPEKYLLMCVGLLANHLYSSNFIFLSDGLMVVAERAAGLADLDCP